MNFVSFVNHSGVEIFLQRPPDRFHVFIRKRDIGIREVDPVSHLTRHRFPISLILPDGLLTFLIKLLDAVSKNVILVLHAEHFFYFDLDGESVRVPACLTVYLIARHSLVTAHRVFQRPRHHMMDPRAAIRRRRTLVESVQRFPFPGRNALLENLVRFPKGENFFFDFGVIYFIGKLFEHRKQG